MSFANTSWSKKAPSSSSSGVTNGSISMNAQPMTKPTFGPSAFAV
jgi:hypothetical protein